MAALKLLQSIKKVIGSCLITIQNINPSVTKGFGTHIGCQGGVQGDIKGPTHPGMS